MPKKRRKYSAEFKSDVVRMVLRGGESHHAVAREFELRPDMVQRWVRKAEEHPDDPFPGKGKQRDPAAELSKVRRELARVREERDILKKAIAIFSEPRR